jgi:hypothetical protein
VSTDTPAEVVADGPGGIEGEPVGGVLDWLLVVGLTLLTAWTAVLAVFFLPLHAGPVPLPVSILLAVAVLVAAPRWSYRLTGRLLAAFLPAAAWFVVTVVLTQLRNDLYPLPVTVVTGQWRVVLLLGAGSITAAAVLALLWGDRTRAQLAGPDGAGAGTGRSD